MIVEVDTASPVPVFEQLRAQIERLIVSGQLAPGVRLPPIRHLAVDLGLARGTVNKVYDALARDGLVATAGRNGTVVLPPTEAGTGTAQADLADAAERLALTARQLGVDPAAAHAALDAALGVLSRPAVPPG
ncbi:GntR family transcriptional regulator [Occultella gossypii]|uniref:GntR family transcriptional regulator n=1 Tax=Occultella gossypii TaxID=2800820 RepID=A0ABS7SGU7_9MICO|nr:GntR family transcriptional regulator [Occultella gossypii]MBZ2199432.1 GntR family transcriptional regulator [Occultella gossypii]